jgi:hypothetical protein
MVMNNPAASGGVSVTLVSVTLVDVWMFESPQGAGNLP